MAEHRRPSMRRLRAPGHVEEVEHGEPAKELALQPAQLHRRRWALVPGPAVDRGVLHRGRTG